MENIKPMNDEQKNADRTGKAVVYKYLNDKYQNAVTRIWDTDHKSKTAR